VSKIHWRNTSEEKPLYWIWVIVERTHPKEVDVCFGMLVTDGLGNDCWRMVTKDDLPLGRCPRWKPLPG
jgi:hypothetical protein